MANCYFCGKKLSVLSDGGRPLFDNDTHKELKICMDCSVQRSKIRGKQGNITEAEILTFTSPILMGNEYPDNVKALVQSWIDEGKQNREKQAAAAQFKEEYEQYRTNFPITTGFGFDGFTITEYKGVVCGDSVLGTGFLSDLSAALADLSGSESSKMIDKMNEAREFAKKRMIEVAITKLNANAIIGAAFSYTVLAGNMLSVSISGTAVIREKISGQ